MWPRTFVFALFAIMLLVATLGHGYFATQPVHAQTQTLEQPLTKRNVYVFLVQFNDLRNQTSPAQILNKLDEVNSYFTNVTYGAWQFRWTLIYPSLGQPWFVANETYAQASQYDTNVSAEIRVNQVITQAWNGVGPFPSIQYDTGNLSLFNNTNVFLLIHAGNSSTSAPLSSPWVDETGGPGYLPYVNAVPNIAYDLSVVAENDPTGVICFELTHQLMWHTEHGANFPGLGQGFPDPRAGVPSSGVPPTVSPTPWDLMFGGGAPYPYGPSPSEYGVFDRLTLGFPINVTTVSKGETATVALHDIEQHTSGIQGILIPIRTQIVPSGNVHDLFYIVELREAIDGDSYFPWNTAYFPDKTGLLIWYFNVSQNGNTLQSPLGYLVRAHSLDVDGQFSMFGPCGSTPTYPQSCSETSMNDSNNNIGITILSTSNSSFLIRVSNTPNGPLITFCPTPSIFCFLGFLDFGWWGFLLNAILAGLIPGFLITIAVLRRNRKEHRPVPIKTRERTPTL